MKILHINTSYDKGGAALLMRALAKNIVQNQDVEQLFIVKGSTKEKTRDIFQAKDVSNVLGYQKLSRIASEYGFLYQFLPLETHLF